MIRDLAALTQERFDLAVVGGGVYGLSVARDAALRGLRVALIERHDFGAGTTSNSLKIVHGGLRYLQHADLRRMRASIRERSMWLATAPHLVRPLRCLMPTHGSWTRSRWAMGLALLANDVIGFDRNRSGDPERHLPRGRIISAQACRLLDPEGSHAAVSGGAVWYDAQMIDSERLTLALLQSAQAAGAVAANRVEASGLHLEGNRVAGVLAHDRVGGQAFPLRARVTVNAAGPWLDQWSGTPPQPLSVAMNLVLRRPLTGECAVGITSRVPGTDGDVLVGDGSRLLFLTPWRGVTIAGTTHLPHPGRAATFRLRAHHVESFLAEINAARPGARLRLDDVALVHHGLLPAVATPGTGVTLAKHGRIIDHGRGSPPLPGLISVVGVKWTTARSSAAGAVDAVFRCLGHVPPPCLTMHTPLPGGDIPSLARWRDSLPAAAASAGVPLETARRLAARYGTDWTALLPLAEGHAALLQPLGPGVETLGIEVLHAARAEMAGSLADVVRRRTDLGTAVEPPAAALERAGQILAAEFSWTPARLAKEIETVRELYRLPD